jgi:EmrB/QacA subfamily drug resistance transporter
MRTGTRPVHERWTVATVSVATFMLLLDITVANTALPAIREDLGASFTDLQWVIDAYTLTLAAFVLAAGSLADRFGRRRLFVVGLGVFIAASLLAGAAPDPTFLIISRAVQGLGAAIVFAVSLVLIAHASRAGRERAVAMSAYGATIGVAMAVGPLVGGALTGPLGWRAVFLVNVPIGATAIAAAFLRLRESRDDQVSRLDWAGLTLFGGALFALVLALLRGNHEGWGSPLIVSLIAGAAVLLAAFTAVEHLVPEPMLPLDLFKRRSFAGVQIAAFVLVTSTSALYLYLTLYLQSHLGHTPLETGFRFVAIAIPILVVAPIAGVLLTQVHARVLIATGLALGAAGLLLVSGLDTRSHSTSLVAGFVVLGAGVGLLQPVIAHTAIRGLPERRGGIAGGVNNTFRVVGAAVGIAAWGAIFLARGTERLSELVAGSSAAADGRPRRLLEAASAGNLDAALATLPPAARDRAADAAGEGLVAGLNDILTLAAGIALAGALLALWLIREPEPSNPSATRRIAALDQLASRR